MVSELGSKDVPQTLIHPSPLQLERYYIKELSCSVKDNFIDQQGLMTPPASPRLTANVSETQLGEDERRWRFELMVSSTEDAASEFPYELRVVLVGFFKVHEDYPEPRVNNLARVNGPAVLYSAAREALVMLTGRTGYPALVLPTIYFSPPVHTEAEAAPKQLMGSQISEATAESHKTKRGARKATRSSLDHPPES